MQSSLREGFFETSDFIQVIQTYLLFSLSFYIIFALLPLYTSPATTFFKITKDSSKNTK